MTLSQVTRHSDGGPVIGVDIAVSVAFSVLAGKLGRIELLFGRKVVCSLGMSRVRETLTLPCREDEERLMHLVGGEHGIKVDKCQLGGQ